MTIEPSLIRRAIKKAGKSNCRQKISALGFNKSGDLIYISSNRPRFSKKGGSIHAEMSVMANASRSLRSILICRVGLGGDLLPIDPCRVCAQKAQELGIRIISVKK